MIIVNGFHFETDLDVYEYLNKRISRLENMSPGSYAETQNEKEIEKLKKEIIQLTNHNKALQGANKEQTEKVDKKDEIKSYRIACLAKVCDDQAAEILLLTQHNEALLKSYRIAKVRDLISK